jgi:protein TonB
VWTIADRNSGLALSGGDTTAQSAYLGIVRAQLEKAKINPHSNITGTAVVHFVVDASGRIISREIITSSGHKVLDDAAVASIERASPFPPMPKTLTLGRIDVSVPFKFSVR